MADFFSPVSVDLNLFRPYPPILDLSAVDLISPLVSLFLCLGVSSSYKRLQTRVCSWLHIAMAEHNTSQEADITKTQMNVNVESQKEKPVGYGPDGQENLDDVPDENAQDGVRIAEAMTLSWSKSSLIIVYIW